MTLASRPAPTTDAAVYDLLRECFGIGDWDEDGPMPWHKARMREAAKIKSMRTKRHLSFADFVLIADYCRRRRLQPKTAWELLTHYGMAKVEQRRAMVPELDLEVDMALANERSRPDPDPTWIRRLAAAAGPARREVLEQWRRERG